MSDALHPPLSQEVTANLGPQLLGHVRSLDAASSSSTTYKAVDEAIECLQRLIAVASRQGIFQNDLSMAENLLMALNASTSSAMKNKTSKNRRSDDDHDGDAALSTTLPIQLVMTAILRILGLREQALEFSDSALLITLACDLIRAVVHHAHGDPNSSSHRHSICLQAEHEWIQGSVKSILSSLCQTVPKLLWVLQQEEKVDDIVECREALTSCLFASADLIELAGTRLSRSQTILSKLENAAWDAMPYGKVECMASATLLAVLPLAGGTERATPASQWTKSMKNAQILLWLLFQKSIPISQRIIIVQNADTSPSLQRKMDEWTMSLQRLESQEDRVGLVLHWVQSLVSLMIKLLRQSQGNTALLESTLDIPSLLDLVDALLAVPMSAEATYYGTKKRLRDEPLDSGYLSPASIATRLANHVYCQGQELLSQVTLIIGGPSLLPYAQRLRQVGYAGVLTACSPTLRQVLEPSYNISKKRRWLPHSLVTRSAALRTLQVLLVSLGVQPTSERGKTRRRSSTPEMDRIVKVVSGCLLEQLYPHEEENIDWGSREEKDTMISTAADCLSTILSSGGEFLTMESRQLTDSVTATCLEYLTKSTQVASLATTTMCKSCLELGKACVSTSWPDGAASALRFALCQAAEAIAVAGDSSLVWVASSARQLCDMLSNPTIPALYVVSRQQEDPPLAQELVAKLDQARVDARAQKERKEEEERQRKKAKLEKKQAKVSTAAASEQADTKSVGAPSEAETGIHILDSRGSAPVSGATKAPTSVEGPKKTPLPKVHSRTTPTPTPASKALTDSSLESKKVPNNDSESDLDEDFPMIVDAGPDEEDADDDD